MARGELKSHSIHSDEFQLLVDALTVPSLYCITIGARTQELGVIELPGGQGMESSGREKNVECDITVAIHDDLQMAALNVWWEECRQKVPTYKKSAFLNCHTPAGEKTYQEIWTGVWIKSRELPEWKTDPDGDMQVMSMSLSIDFVDNGFI